MQGFLRGGSLFGGLLDITDHILLVEAAKGYTFNGIGVHRTHRFLLYIRNYYNTKDAVLQGEKKSGEKMKKGLAF